MSSPSSPKSAAGAPVRTRWAAALLVLSLVILACLVTGLSGWAMALAVAAYPVPLVMASGALSRRGGLALAGVLVIPVAGLLLLEAAPWNAVWLGLPLSLHWLIAGLWLLPLGAVTWLYVRSFSAGD